MSKRKVKQFNLENNHFSIEYGTMDRNNPKVIYVENRCWIQPLEEMDYQKEIEKITNAIKQHLRVNLIRNNNFDNQFIFQTSINANSMSLKHGKLFTIELYLKQNANDIKTIQDVNIKDFIEPNLNFIKEIFENNFFAIRKNKKE